MCREIVSDDVKEEVEKKREEIMEKKLDTKNIQ